MTSKSLLLYRLIPYFIRLPETESVQDNSVSVRSLGQLNGLNTTNDSELNALAGLDTLLQVLQSTSTSTASTPSPDCLTSDFSRSHESAVRVAATAFNQLPQQVSHQEALDTYCPFDGMIQSVCPPPTFGYIRSSL